MLNCLIRGMMRNLETWMEIEENSMFRYLYVQYYDILKEKIQINAQS